MDLSRIDILDVATRLGLPLHPIQGGRQWLTPCWACHDRGMPPDAKSKKGHLTIRPDKQVFRCPRCGFSGNAWVMIKDHLGEENGKEFLADMSKTFPSRISRPVIKEQPAAPVETRNVVYNAFLEKMILSPRHREDLNNRGLPNDVIEKNGYKSTLGWDSTQGVCAGLIKEGYSLKGIPGFYKDKEQKWRFMTLPGFLIPVRNEESLIQGLQIRIDENFLSRKPDLRKYIWLSSVGKCSGTSSGAPVHMAGVNSLRPDTKLWITEGPLKADIAFLYMGLPFFGVAGTSLYEQAASEVNRLGIKKTRVAYDADSVKNQHVRDAEIELIKELKARGINALPVTWGEALGKGVDDMLLSVSDGQYPVSHSVLNKFVKINKELQLEIEVTVDIKVRVRQLQTINK